MNDRSLSAVSPPQALRYLPEICARSHTADVLLHTTSVAKKISRSSKRTSSNPAVRTRVLIGYRPVSSLSLGRLARVHGSYGFVFTAMLLDEITSRASDPAPLAHQINATEKIWLQTHTIEAAHVCGRIDSLELDARRSRRKSLRFVAHIALAIHSATISCFQAVLYWFHAYTGTPLKLGKVWNPDETENRSNDH